MLLTDVCLILSLLQDKQSMLNLTHAIDRATGYVYSQPSSSAPPDTVNPLNPNAPYPTDSNDPNAPGRSQRPNQYALFSTAAGPLTGMRSDVRDVQERWIDAREEWDASERREWRREGEAIRNAKAREVVENTQAGSKGGAVAEEKRRIKNKIRIRPDPNADMNEL